VDSLPFARWVRLECPPPREQRNAGSHGWRDAHGGREQVSGNSGNENMDEQERLQLKLAELKTEHRDLDQVIDRLTEKGPIDLIQVQRLKKRKLVLKDMISKIESLLLPDIIA
jgi:hypothetical protein